MESADCEAEQKTLGAVSVLPKLTQAGYSSLDVCWGFDSFSMSHRCSNFIQLIRYFTCGPDEVRAWTIRKGTKAPQAAGVIQSVFFFSFHFPCMDSHLSNLAFLSTDFENKFICGEIMTYDDLKEHGSEAAVKAAGKLRQQGKPYESACYCILAVSRSTVNGTFKWSMVTLRTGKWEDDAATSHTRRSKLEDGTSVF
jgi:obg-like ATPase 1